MTQIYSVNHALDYQVPTKEEVLLTAELAATVREFGKIKRDALHHLCVIAYGIRRQNLKKVTGRGGNQRGEAYKDEFRAWYEQYKIIDVYGSLSGFTQYAMAGRLLTYTRWQVGERHLAQLPSSLGALYGLSKTVWHQGKEATDDSRKAYKDLLVTPVRDGSTNNAFIHPAMTIADVDAKIEALQPTGSNANKAPKDKDEMTISLATIKIHKDLYKFNRSGTKRTISGPKIDEVRVLVEKINALLLEYGDEKFVLKSNLEEIEEKYDNSGLPDFAKNI